MRDEVEVFYGSTYTGFFGEIPLSFAHYGRIYPYFYTSAPHSYLHSSTSYPDVYAFAPYSYIYTSATTSANPHACPPSRYRCPNSTFASHRWGVPEPGLHPLARLFHTLELCLVCKAFGGKI